MKQIFKVLFLILICTDAMAQISSNSWKCKPVDENLPYFEIKTEKNFVLVNLKGNTFKIPYDNFYIDKDGDKWDIYQNKHLRVGVIANSKYASIGNFPYDSYNYVIISHGYCE